MNRNLFVNLISANRFMINIFRNYLQIICQYRTTCWTLKQTEMDFADTRLSWCKEQFSEICASIKTNLCFWRECTTGNMFTLFLRCTGIFQLCADTIIGLWQSRQMLGGTGMVIPCHYCLLLHLPAMMETLIK